MAFQLVPQKQYSVDVLYEEMTKTGGFKIISRRKIHRDFDGIESSFMVFANMEEVFA